MTEKIQSGRHDGIGMTEAEEMPAPEEEKRRGGIREFTVTRTLMDENLTAKILMFSTGIAVSLYGGSLPHIGAVSIVNPDGGLNTTQFPGHRDAVITEKWAEAIADEEIRPVTVAAGIHYDNLTPEEIAAVVSVTDEMLKEVLQKIKQ